jgi:hypothetical protein
MRRDNIFLIMIYWITHPPQYTNTNYSNVKYDLIISISTFEHIGYDEVKRYGKEDKAINKENLMLAIKKTKTLLKSQGVFVFTVPLGFNHFLDSKIAENELGLSEMFFLKRIIKNNQWLQVEYNEIKDVHYGSPFPCANGLMIGIFRNE